MVARLLWHFFRNGFTLQWDQRTAEYYNYGEETLLDNCFIRSFLDFFFPRPVIIIHIGGENGEGEGGCIFSFQTLNQKFGSPNSGTRPSLFCICSPLPAWTYVNVLNSGVNKVHRYPSRQSIWPTFVSHPQSSPDWVCSLEKLLMAIPLVTYIHNIICLNKLVLLGKQVTIQM